MITKCPHCGARFKASSELKGKRTKCPKCKQAFTIEEFDAGLSPSAGRSSDDEKKVRICTNCDREIGHLEEANIYHDNLVCLECYNRLTRQAASPLVSGGYDSFKERAIDEAQVVRGKHGWADTGFVGYAGFWRRFAAAFIDGIIVNADACIIGLAIGILLIATGASEGAELGSVEPLLNLLGIFITWFYYALMESSAKQATLGKMALGIIVTDVDGERISFGRATGRYFAKLISIMTLLIGYIMAGFTEKKQALHDMIAGCLVVCKR